MGGVGNRGEGMVPGDPRVGARQRATSADQSSIPRRRRRWVVHEAEEKKWTIASRVWLRGDVF